MTAPARLELPEAVAAGIARAGYMVKGREADVLSLDEQRRRREVRERFSLQRSAAGLLEGEPAFKRVTQCQRSLQRLGVAVDLVEGDKGDRAEFAGVLTCDNRWCCALCAAKLTEQDRRELQHGMTLWVGQGGAVLLLTFTFPHHVELPLAEGLAKMQQAQRRLKGKRAYKDAMKAAGAIGSVKALEVTYGANGWHPHVHMLAFVAEGGAQHLEAVRDMWADAVRAVGLGNVNEHGFDLRGGDFAADYVAKFGKEPGAGSIEQARAWWSASHELTKGHTKQTQRMKGATPFTLLRWHREGDARAGALFVEYAKAFKGRAQLYWSPRLRKKIDLFALEQPKAPPPRRTRLVQIALDDWRAVLRHDARWEVLYVAERYGAAAVEALLYELRTRKGRWRDSFSVTAAEPWPRPGGVGYLAHPWRNAA